MPLKTTALPFPGRSRATEKVNFSGRIPLLKPERRGTLMGTLGGRQASL